MAHSFRIRRIHDDVLPINRQALADVGRILRENFPAAREEEVKGIGPKLRNPLGQRFRTVLYVAETMRHKVLGFALVLHEPEIGFSYLDWIATAKGRSGGGLGGALYDRVREDAATLGARGLFFECLPDDPDECSDSVQREQNRARLRFYERYGARPVVGTAYETPVREQEQKGMPHLVFDGLDTHPLPDAACLKQVVKAILERKYGYLCPPEYVRGVLDSIRDGAYGLRELRYMKPARVRARVHPHPSEPMVLVVNETHAMHHIRERGYAEAPVRVQSILAALDGAGLAETVKASSFPDSHVLAVHDRTLVSYLRQACADMPEGKVLYPYVFPIRNKTRPPREPSVLPGYYAMDTFTPISRNAWPAARGGVNCALTAARALLEGRRVAYALTRPPGHHAERTVFGGFCYLNNAAIAAQYLRAHGRVAILDLDYHHGNGQQDIFYGRSDVLTVSIHGHPSFAYPYFAGFEDEIGEGDGEGFNRNLPLPETVDGPKYRKALESALSTMQSYAADFLVVPLGLDPAKSDPTGTWALRAADFEANGQLIGALGLPVLVVQEGGYRTLTLGQNARAFFTGLVTSSQRQNSPGKRRHVGDLTLREEPVPSDRARVRDLIDATGFFLPHEVPVAVELVEERLARGLDSGYHFVFAESGGRLAGYSAFGPIACTAGSWDLYWIAVHPDFQGQGVGRKLLERSEQRIREQGGRRVYIETSSRPQYTPTRAFYEKTAYTLETVLEDFYGPGDGKVIYCKVVG
ncbi:MAG: GNAT family N-acetyltransferase [Lentisphaeria bacterium]|nr:GNAT family N-acetyltransferase [Lentisphaeria bacterium]